MQPSKPILTYVKRLLLICTIGELAGKLKFLISTLLNEIQDGSQNGVHFG